MKNTIKISYLEIKKYLQLHEIEPISDLSDKEEFISINSIESSNENDITFLSNNSSTKLILKTKAKACLVNKNFAKYLPKNTKAIIVENPYKSFAIISNIFKKDLKSNGLVSKLSYIDDESFVDENVQIDPFVHISKNSHINKNVIIESNCTIGPNVKIGQNTIIKSNTKLENCEIGSDCIIKSGAIIGGTGFGFDPISKTRIQHFGKVIIHNNCNIGSNTTIDRAVFGETVISENCFIDNLVQIAHNVFIGKGGIIAAQTGIAGSTTIGENIMIGGQAGISGHLNIGKNVTIAAKSGVTKNIDSNSIVAGFPAVDIKKWKMLNIKLNKIL